MWFTVVSLAFAAVEVTDDHECIDDDTLDNELRLLLGDALVEHLAIQVATTEAPSNPDALEVHTLVREGTETLWTRSAVFGPEDCPVIPEALALSVQQGLAQLPGWSFEVDRDGPDTVPTVHVFASGGLPLDGRFGAHAGVSWVPRTLGLWTQARLQTGPPFEVGDGAATIVHPALAIGPILRTRGPLQPDVWLLASAGPLVAFGSRFDTDKVVVLPRAALELGAGIHPGGPVHIGLFAELPVARVRLIQGNGQGRTEPAVRAGFTVGVM